MGKNKSTEIPEESKLRFREKRKWQIAFRRYVIQKNVSPYYAPYFGLDIDNIRKWFEYQFPEGIGWEDFGSRWQFEHIIPVTYFNFSEEEDLKLCWNFVNIRVGLIETSVGSSSKLDILGAKNYFKTLFDGSESVLALKLLHKIDHLELTEMVNTAGQLSFLKEKADYLRHIEHYSAFEFEMLNRGRSLEDVEKEMAIIRKFGS
jgi:hypothetical protein